MKLHHLHMQWPGINKEQARIPADNIQQWISLNVFYRNYGNLPGTAKETGHN